ncbi:phosphonate ABC transporter ATP-binding protein [Natronomonas sp. F2-12]|uniref:Phosphonate ABC transporter ATP-binding protein n=1 Tax=Natronomonas aquatica TaxID=2841590 RepID=A0A9R1CQL6_9EURY|nr:phosphonate ABC transporter ATP-binding protein [Natronomonas aquatica]MCQ4331921.1 phosphonate ABC transporter ATP-binding protein [Natronomonas aquatica]
MLKINDLVKVYPTGDRALDGVSTTIGGNSIVAMIGPSGAGKSTFVRCINRLVEPTSGQVWLDDVEITSLSKNGLRRERRNMGMVFQEYGLVERLTVMENVLSGRLGYTGFWKSFRRKYPKEDIQKAYATLDRVGMLEMADKRVDELSGGQRQRVGIARAVLQTPKLLLVDEPTSSLDPETSRKVMELLTEIAREDDIPVLINIHEVNLAEQFADRILGLSDGGLVFEGSTDELDESVKNKIYRSDNSQDQDDISNDKTVVDESTEIESNVEL